MRIWELLRFEFYAFAFLSFDHRFSYHRLLWYCIDYFQVAKHFKLCTSFISWWRTVLKKRCENSWSINLASYFDFGLSWYTLEGLWLCLKFFTYLLFLQALLHWTWTSAFVLIRYSTLSPRLRLYAISAF